MSEDTKYMVLIVQYKEEDEEAIEDLLEKSKGLINAKYGKVWCSYKGFEKQIISALENILGLTKHE